jgi:hypothetical protein
MHRARLGLKARAWAQLWRARACINPRPGPQPRLELGSGLAWAWARALHAKTQYRDRTLQNVGHGFQIECEWRVNLQA